MDRIATQKVDVGKEVVNSAALQGELGKKWNVQGLF